MFKDYYKILSVSQQASKAEIKEAYRVASKRWHPDVNPGINTTSKMQDINEAYAILKDEEKRKRYDAEYILFKQKAERQKVKSSDSSWSYDYEVHDENLKNDINSARQYAKDLVDEFLASLKKTSKDAAKGAWDGSKFYIFAAIVLSMIGLVVASLSSCTSDLKKGSSYNNNRSDERSSIYEGVKETDEIKEIDYNESRNSYQVPSSWKSYTIKNRFSISVPPSVELRDEYQYYTRLLKNKGLWVDNDMVIFQQKGLSDNASNNHYCRIMMQYFSGEKGNFQRRNETVYIDSEFKQEILGMVEDEVKPFSLISGPSSKWIDINGTKALEIKYRRNGTDNNTTNCTIYILQNYSEAAKIIVSYREQEQELWMPDLGNVVRTFRWE